MAPPQGTTDPTPGNNSATDTDTIQPVADLAIVKTGPAGVNSNGAVSYSVVVSNAGIGIPGLLHEVRAADLRFNLDEAAELLRQVSADLDLSIAAALAERTEGWAVGLQLAALSMQGRDDAAGFTTLLQLLVDAGDQPVDDRRIDSRFAQEPGDRRGLPAGGIVKIVRPDPTIDGGCA